MFGNTMLMDRLRCRRVLRYLQRYLDGDVDQDTEQRLTRHIQACRRCGREYWIYDRIRQEIAQRSTADSDAVGRLEAYAAELTVDSREE